MGSGIIDAFAFKNTVCFGPHAHALVQNGPKHFVSLFKWVVCSEIIQKPNGNPFYAVHVISQYTCTLQRKIPNSTTVTFIGLRNDRVVLFF